MKLIDMTGQRFGLLTVQSLDASSTPKRKRWLCKCECGKTSSVLGSNLRGGLTKSCGCGQAKTKHGMYGTKVYRVWNAMVQRCTNERATHYDRYGGRGVKVCDEWKDFGAFYRDMGEPAPGLTLDRIDNDGDYCPSNCRWASRKAQTANRHNTVRYAVGGEVLTLDELARKAGMSREQIRARLRRGWPIDRAIGVTK